MKLFIKKTTLYFLLVISLFFIIQYAVDSGLKNCYQSPYCVWTSIRKDHINADVVCLGSSRVKKHIETRYFGELTNSKVFNLGLDGANTYLQQAIWNVYIQHNTPPKLLVLELDMLRLEKDKSIFNKDRFLPILSDQGVYPVLKGIKSFDYTDVILPFYKYHDYRQAVLLGCETIIKPKKDTALINDQGYERLDGTLKVADIKPPKEVTIPLTEVEASLNIIAQLVSFIKGNGGKVVLVNAPRFKTSVVTIKNRREIQSLLDAFLNEHHLSYLNFEADPHFDTKLFYDQEHLNHEGSLIFTRLLAEKLVELNLIHT